MKITDIIGKTVTNIYLLEKADTNGLDICECFVELDNKCIIDIPFDFCDEILIKELNRNAVSLFADLSDYSIYHVNKEKKTIAELADKYRRKRKSVFSRLRKIIFGQDIVKEYKPYKVEHSENELKYIKNRKIVDFICFTDEDLVELEKGFILLDNGYLITETIVAPHGTGRAGLNYYKNISDLTNEKGSEYVKLSNKFYICSNARATQPL